MTVNIQHVGPFFGGDTFQYQKNVTYFVPSGTVPETALDWWVQLPDQVQQPPPDISQWYYPEWYAAAYEPGTMDWRAVVVEQGTPEPVASIAESQVWIPEEITNIFVPSDEGLVTCALVEHWQLQPHLPPDNHRLTMVVIPPQAYMPTSQVQAECCYPATPDCISWVYTEDAEPPADTPMDWLTCQHEIPAAVLPTDYTSGKDDCVIKEPLLPMPAAFDQNFLYGDQYNEEVYPRARQLILTAVMVSVLDGSAIDTGVRVFLTPDGGTQIESVNSPQYEGNGQWSCVLSAAEMDAEVVGIVWSAGEAHYPQHYTVRTR